MVVRTIAEPLAWERRREEGTEFGCYKSMVESLGLLPGF